KKENIMFSQIKKLFKKKFVRNVFIVASGAVGAQALSLFLSPIITRLYGPEAAGVLGSITALRRSIIPIAALIYPVAIVLLSGDVVSQALSLLLSLIITRLYGPEAFGVLGTFTALTRIIIPIAALTYPVAIVLPKSDKNAKTIIKLSFIITVFMSIVSLITLL